MRVLLSDGSHKNTLAISRYLGKNGHAVHLLHHKKSAPGFSKYCKSLILTPNIQDEKAYVTFLLEHLRKNKYDILIPVGVLAYKYCVDQHEEILKHTYVAVVSKASFELAINKMATFRFAEKHGIDHPKTFYPENMEQALAISDSVAYPAVIKSSNESIVKFPTVYVESKEALTDQLIRLQTDYGREVDTAFPIIQERIHGNGFGFFAVYQNGVCKKIFMHKRIRENPVSGGVSTTAESFYDEKLLSAGKKILDKLKWHGQAMVEFKQDRSTGIYKLIEINPKFWGSLELSLNAGMNFPEHLCMMAQGEELEYSIAYHRKRRFVWLVAVDGELYRFLQKPLDLFPLIYDLLRFRSRTDFWWTDLKPTFVQIIYYILWLKDRCFKRGKSK